jgi:cytoskeletal protein CcmA (bactofilin family)
MIHMTSRTRPEGVAVNRRIIVTLAALATLVVPSSALSATTAARTGSFDAMGTGTIVLQGKLRVFGTIQGTVIVRDRVGGAVVRIGGTRQKPKVIRNGGTVVRVYTLRKVDDSFYAKGDNIRVELRSPEANVSMSAFGRGRVIRLTGEGTYHLNGGTEEAWSSAVVPIAIQPPPPEPPNPSAAANEVAA